jgi:Flp pilus assembly pilin Flp
MGADLRSRLFDRWTPENGQGLVEYTLILALVSVFAVAAATTLGTTIVTRLFSLSGSL